MTRANDTQTGGAHYKSLPVQPWDYAILNELGFAEGSVVKYVTRWRKKNGVEDLEKAAHFIQKLIEIEREKDSED